MFNKLANYSLSCLLITSLGFFQNINAQFVNVGDGGYTTQFPGTDQAGRNSFPSGNPFVTGKASNVPVPTNDWWSAQIKNDHADNLFNYPYTLKSDNSGLVVSYIPWGVIDNILPVVVGVDGLNSSAVNVSDFSDWLVEMEWRNGSHQMNVTTGIGMPFLYFSKNTTDVARIEVNQGTAVVSNEMLVITDARNGADFVVYAPVGSTWQKSGSAYTSSLNGKNYWSMAFVPLSAANVMTVANEYKKYAYVFPVNSKTTWNYDKSNSKIITDFEVTTSIKEGIDSLVLMGLLPHQWANLSNSSAVPNKYEYQTVRGVLKTMAGNRFSTENTYYGILPTLPYLDYYSSGFKPNLLNDKIQNIKNDQLNPWTDSYNEGQMMNRLIQSARIAELSGDIESLKSMTKTVKDRLEDWLKAESGEKAFLFYYNNTWSTLIGYPAGHGQDNNINDHHFHWGYFIHAAAFVEQMEPGWANKWGDMINLLIRDAANPSRTDAEYPFLRNFSPYAGHCWANGFASFPQGNDQESTSESMQFNSSLIHWGSITNNDTIRDLGIYLYTTEQSAIEEYWLDMEERVFQPNQQYSLVSRVWGNSYDNGTFWTSDIAASYGIEMYPIHGGSLYLGQDSAYVTKLWNEIEANTGILKNEENPNLWHDIYWEYLAFIDPQKAIQLYDSNPNRNLKFGVSDVQTYHWLHAFNSLGKIAKVTANHPMAAVFYKGNDTTYVAHNYSNAPISVSFSDGAQLLVPAHTLRTSKDISILGTLSSSYDRAYANGSVDLDLAITGGIPTKVEFYQGETLIGTDTQAPFSIKANNLKTGKFQFYARVYDGSRFNISNLVQVRVGDAQPFLGNPFRIPGVIEPGNYDYYEGGLGQGVSYYDASTNNEGKFRSNEYVDAEEVSNEGRTVGWINSGEWLSYSIDVQQAGLYDVDIRYASGNTNGGGPMYFVLDDDTISAAVYFPNTNGWDKWQTKKVTNVRLKTGLQNLEVRFGQGEFNMGKMIFSFDKLLPYSQPIADAGTNLIVKTPINTASLSGANSSDPGGGTLSYQWRQVYGPSNLIFSQPTMSLTNVSGVQEGVYLIELMVDNGLYKDYDEVYLISSPNDNIVPKVSIFSPFDNSSFIAGDDVVISAVASDLNGTVSEIDFYAGTEFIGKDSQKPFEVTWKSKLGTYELTAVAKDNDGGTATSSIILINVVPAPSCRDTSANGDFYFEFSEDENNPTLTFIPSLSGVGSPTCILYYGSNPNALPGYPVTPNVPFRLTASSGDVINFYYTYTYPGQGERNNSANKDQYKIGSCRVPDTSSENVNVNFLADMESPINIYPNPTTDNLTIELNNRKVHIQLFDISGALIFERKHQTGIVNLNMVDLTEGIYIVRVSGDERMEYFKVLKTK